MDNPWVAAQDPISFGVVPGEPQCQQACDIVVLFGAKACRLACLCSEICPEGTFDGRDEDCRSAVPDIHGDQDSR